MFKKVKPHKKFTDAAGNELIPVATLKNGDKLYHVVVQEDCYVPYFGGIVDPYYPTPFLIPELLTVLRELPDIGEK